MQYAEASAHGFSTHMPRTQDIAIPGVTTVTQRDMRPSLPGKDSVEVTVAANFRAPCRDRVVACRVDEHQKLPSRMANTPSLQQKGISALE